jgi:pantetheine-phosphate adenylyltransferase
MTIGVFAGSFDPFTFGHSSIIHDATKFCDQVVIAIGVNSNKNPLFSLEERISFIKEATKDFKDNIVIGQFSGLLVDYVAGLKPIKNPTKLLIRGVRSTADFEYEANLSLINKKLNPSIDTILLISDPDCAIISSSMVKEVASYGHDVRSFVYPTIAKALAEKFKTQQPS